MQASIPSGGPAAQAGSGAAGAARPSAAQRAAGAPAQLPPQMPRSWIASPGRPVLPLPPGACDSHLHVFGPPDRFPYAADRPFTPSAAPCDAMLALHRHLGITRRVIVQSTCHGLDNAVTLDAIAADPDNSVGIALLPLDVADAELDRLDRAGIRGVRFNLMPHLGEGPSFAAIAPLAARLARLGWHLQIHCAPTLIAELSPAIRRSPVPVVIDHMGRVDAAGGIHQAPFQALLSLLDSPHVHVKVSGSERASRQGPPWDDAVVLARALVERVGDRVLWGTDWPHPNLAGGSPDDGALVDLLARIAPDAAARQALLVDNPARLYRFAGAVATRRST